jgi:hypothetical protein
MVAVQGSADAEQTPLFFLPFFLFLFFASTPEAVAASRLPASAPTSFKKSLREVPRAMARANSSTQAPMIAPLQLHGTLAANKNAARPI